MFQALYTHLLIEHSFGVVCEVVLLIGYHQQYGEGQQEGSSGEERHAAPQPDHAQVAATHPHCDTHSLHCTLVLFDI